MPILPVGTLLLLCVGASHVRALPHDNTPAEIRILGQLNVNTASKEELLTVPGLDDNAVETILAARKKGPLTDLQALGSLPLNALSHLKLSGDSDYRRIRKLPFQIMDRRRMARAHP
jgi:hypothetical protein